MIIRFLKTIIVISFLFSLSLNAYEIGSFSLINDKGVGGPNEDRVVTLNKEQLLKQNNPCDFFAAVFDGHKGPMISGFMSKHVFTLFGEYIEIESTINKALAKTFEDFDDATKNCFQGSTAVVCCKKNKTLYLANVGDSKAVLFGNNNDGKKTIEHKIEFGSYGPNAEALRIIQSSGEIALAHYLTLRTGGEKTYYQIFTFKNNNPRNYEIIWCDCGWEPIAEDSNDMEIIKNINSSEEKSFFEEVYSEWYAYKNELVSVDGEDRLFVGGLGMSRSFGDCFYKSIGVNAIPDLYSWDLKPDDKYLVIASDGLWNAFDPEDVEGIIDGGVLCGQSVEQITKRLCNEARFRGCPDDISVVLVIFDASDFVS